MLSNKSRHNRFIIIGLLISAFGLLYALCWENIFKHLSEKLRVLSPNSRTGELMMNPPLAVKFDYYMFNWTNPEQFRDLNIKPKLQEVGPYSFYEFPEKYNVQWHSDNGTVSFRQRSQFLFNEAGTVGSLSDQIVTVNALSVGIVHKSKYWNPVRRGVIDFGLRLSNHDIVQRKTVDELLFTGFEDDMINIGYNIPSSLTNVKVPFDKFGYFYPRNSSEYGHHYNIYTGAGKPDSMGQISSWNYQKISPFFESSCAKIHGSAGEVYPPNLKQHERVRVFAVDLCRTIEFEQVGIVEVEGIIGYKYITGQRFIDNGTLYPENVCHCNGKCLPSGVVNISSCWFDVPIFASYPHFYGADPSYLESFEGLRPDPNAHELYIVLEPRTGLILDLGIRGQTNLYVEASTALRILGTARSVMFPLFWMDGTLRITPELANELKTIFAYVRYGQIFGSAICVFGLVFAIYFALLRHSQQTRVERQLMVDTVLAKETEQHHHQLKADSSSLLKSADKSRGSVSGSSDVSQCSECSDERDQQCRCSF